MRFSDLIDDICNRLDPEVTMEVAVADVPWCVDYAL
jgi:hypothetical protein